MTSKSIRLVSLLCVVLALTILGITYDLNSIPSGLCGNACEFSSMAPPTTSLSAPQPRSAPVSFGSLILASTLAFMVWANRKHSV